MTLELLPGFPKIHTLGSRETAGIFGGEVEITEKLDGSSIAFGNINGDLLIRSKGALIYHKNLELKHCNKMFRNGIDIILHRFNRGLLQRDWVYYGEYLQKNKHNALCYNKVPHNNIALFGAITDRGSRIQHTEHPEALVTLKNLSRAIDIDVVPLLYRGNYPLQKEGENSLIAELMKKESVLGKAKIEGLVFKNYNNGNFILAKYVSEEFKEVSHGKGKMYKGDRTDKLAVYLSQFCTKARWDKAIQHLRDKDHLIGTAEDIGPLLCELNLDLQDEEKENIKEKLWQMFGKEVFKIAGSGFPQYYLNLLKDSESTLMSKTGITNA